MSDRDYDELAKRVDRLSNLITGGDDPEKGILMKLDRLIQYGEMIKAREERILRFAMIGVGSGLTGFFSFLASVGMWFLHK